MKGILWASLALAGVATLLSGCGKSSTTSSQAVPPRWEYVSFNYHDPDAKTFKDSVAYCYVQFESGTGITIGSNNVPDIGSALNEVGRFGWELCWSDGKKFIVKRAGGIYTNGAFFVGETILSAKQ